MSDQEARKPVTSLVRMAGNAFAVSRDVVSDELVIRKLLKPKPLPLPETAKVVVLRARS